MFMYAEPLCFFIYVYVCKEEEAELCSIETLLESRENEKKKRKIESYTEILMLSFPFCFHQFFISLFLFNHINSVDSCVFLLIFKKLNLKIKIIKNIIIV